MFNDKDYMQRCLFLANLGQGKVFPNPLVGSVIVHSDKIIGEGYHQLFGSAHAEVNAINSVDPANVKYLKESILYVNLEPCCHYGKTPPCSELLIEKGIKKVVIGTLDPNPRIAGKGILSLQNAGIEVVTGICESECLELNSQFFEQFKQQEPKIKFTLKWAETGNGFMGKESYASPIDRELSNALVKRYVHKLRSEHDAILIGKNTALIDNPILDNRHWYGKIPTAILLDQRLEVPKDSQIFKSKRKVVVFNSLKDQQEDNIDYIKTDFNREPKIFWKQLKSQLVSIGIRSVLIEGGSKTLQSFLQSGIESEICRIITPKIWVNGIKAPHFQATMQSSFNLADNKIEIYTL